jgi:flavodoxin
MNTLIIYQSVHQKNTRKVARAMAEAIDADLRKVGEVEPVMVENYDLIGFGSGIFYGKHHQTLLDFVANLPSQQKKTAFIFSTSGAAIKIQHWALRSKLLQKGFQIKGEFTCPGFELYGIFKLIGGFRKGRPSAEDLKQARSFAKKILK